MSEQAENRLKRMKMRAWRRGTKEMDLILGGFADANLADMEKDTLDLFDALLAENDHDLYQWVTGKAPAPTDLAPLIDQISKTLPQ